MNDPAIHPSSAARATAAARQLDWLLGEALGAAAAPRARRAPTPWLAAACVLLGFGAVFGTAHWRHTADTATTAPQDEETRWHECHGPAALAEVPADVRALRCFDFDDAACAQLARFAALERLDLGAMDVDSSGISRSLAITDVGVRSLAKLPKLRWLALGQCHQVYGYGLQALEALPQLEHLDLTYSSVVTEAVERLPRLPSLRSLVLSYCMGFRGRALTAIAAMPGLQRLELANCTTVSAADAMALATMPALRHLDLRDCQGRFRGQTSSGPGRSGPDVFVDEDGDGLPERRLTASEPVPEGAATFVDGDGDDLPDLRVDLTSPSQDGVGITDDVVQALAKLPLTTLRLGGCTSLTDAIGPALAKMTTLRELDLAELPKLTSTVLPLLPAELRVLALADNPQFDGSGLRSLARLTKLEALELKGALLLRDDDLAAILAGVHLQVLGLGDPRVASKMGPGPAAAPRMQLTVRSLARLRQQEQLHTLRLTDAQWLDEALMKEVAGIASLRNLDLQGSPLPDGCLALLAASRSLQQLDLSWTKKDVTAELASLAELPLRRLNLLRTRCAPDRVRKLATEHWPDCDVVMPNGERFRAR
jgi:hypothetical protein